jgi:hypothetical protein
VHERRVVSGASARARRSTRALAGDLATRSLRNLRMNYDALLATGLDRIPVVREFCDLFPNAEHAVVKAKRDIDGWQIVYEWISRSPVYER